MRPFNDSILTYVIEIFFLATTALEVQGLLIVEASFHAQTHHTR